MHSAVCLMSAEIAFIMTAGVREAGGLWVSCYTVTVTLLFNFVKLKESAINCKLMLEQSEYYTSYLLER